VTPTAPGRLLRTESTVTGMTQLTTVGHNHQCHDDDHLNFPRLGRARARAGLGALLWPSNNSLNVPVSTKDGHDCQVPSKLGRLGRPGPAGRARPGRSTWQVRWGPVAAARLALVAGMPVSQSRCTVAR
jgi:hypothetical protein